MCLDRAIEGPSGWTRRQSTSQGTKPAHGRVERFFHATLEGTDAYLEKRCSERGTVYLCQHTIRQWHGSSDIVRGLHDRFRDEATRSTKHLSRGRWPEITLVSSSPFLRQCSGENQDLMCSSSRRSGVSGIWAGRDNLADMHIILTRQGALTARSIRRLCTK